MFQNQYGVNTCSLNVVNRFAFNIIDILIGYFPEITPIEGAHFPMKDTDEEMKKRQMILRFWKRPGYVNLDGFKDSVIVTDLPLTEEEKKYYADMKEANTKNN